MKANKCNKTAYMHMRMSPSLRRRIKEIATKERRTISDQIAYLVEKGLAVIEAGAKTTAD